MHYLKQFLVVVLFTTIVEASEDALILVPQPLDTQQVEIAVVEVPFIIGKALPESAFQAIGLPYIPPSVSFHEHGDINLASIAGVKIDSFHQEGRAYKIELDYGKVEEKYQTEELLSALVDCVYGVAGQGDNAYSVKLKIINLEKDSPLHAMLERLVEEKEKQEESMEK